MDRKEWKKEIFTVPNLLSLFRLVLIPVYMTIYLRAVQPRQYHLAGGILALSCLTDLADGAIARHFGMESTVGKVLDPVADKLTQLALTVCLSARYPALQPVVALLVVKESFQLIAGVLALRRGKMLPGALLPGKVSTAVLFTSLTGLVLFPGLSEHMVRTMALVDGMFLALAFASYILAYLSLARERE